MLLAETTTVQLDWQGLSVLGSLLGGAIVAGAKILASQWKENRAADAMRHAESREDAKEAREENRALSKAILHIQAKTVDTLGGLQREIERVITRLDRIEEDGGRPARRTDKEG